MFLRIGDRLINTDNVTHVKLQTTVHGKPGVYVSFIGDDDDDSCAYAAFHDEEAEALRLFFSEPCDIDLTTIYPVYQYPFPGANP